MKRLKKYSAAIVAIAMVLALILGISAFSQLSSTASAKPGSTTTTVISEYCNDWNHINGVTNNVRGASLHWVLGGNGYTGPITLTVTYTDNSTATFTGEIHGNGSLSADSVGKPGLKIKDATICYYASEQSDHKLTISHVICDTTTTTQEQTTTTTEEETTTTTEEETTTTTEEVTTTTEEVTTTTEEETTTTTEEETTTTTQQETTTTTEQETTTTTEPETTTTTQPVTSTTETPTTVNFVQTDGGAVVNHTPGYVFAALAGILFLAVIITSVFVPLVKRK